MRSLILFFALLLSGLERRRRQPRQRCTGPISPQRHPSRPALPAAGWTGQRELAQQLDAAPVEQWEAILSRAGDGTLTWQPGSDTDYYLLKSALAAAASQGPFDYILYTGDYLAHDFVDHAKGFGGIADASAFAVKTVQFVNRMIAQQFPGFRWSPALGNNDSGTGDYQLALGGPFLTALAPTMPGLAGNLPAQQSFAHGGYYTIAHPTVPGHDFLVLACCGRPSSPMPPGARATRFPPDRTSTRYFEEALASSANKVTLLMHIPPGMDGYSGYKHAPTGEGGRRCGAARPAGKRLSRRPR
jgi:sphingomyelin phosphodiesterase acid-like 3